MNLEALFCTLICEGRKQNQENLRRLNLTAFFDTFISERRCRRWGDLEVEPGFVLDALIINNAGAAP